MPYNNIIGYITYITSAVGVLSGDGRRSRERKEGGGARKGGREEEQGKGRGRRSREKGEGGGAGKGGRPVDTRNKHPDAHRK